MLKNSMTIPKYWVKINYPANDKNGNPITITSRGWSSISLEDANSVAKKRAIKMLDRINNRKDSESYLIPYDKIPLAEPVIEEIKDNDNNTIGIITRNHEGCLVLNTRDLVFIDIDLPQKRNSIIDKIISLFKKLPDNRIKSFENILNVLEKHKLAARFYQTKAGYRVLLEKKFSHSDFNLINIMKEMNADPLYIKLCKKQNCFRARLTPKPYRIGLNKLPYIFPYEESEINEWKNKYNHLISNYSVCKIIGNINNSSETDLLIKIHDDYCNIKKDLPLA